MKDIERWLKKGLIDEKLAEILNTDLKEEAEKKQKFTTQIVLYTIGVILLGTGVITFVAGNDWILELLQSIPVLQIIIHLSVQLLRFLEGGNWDLKQKNSHVLAEHSYFYQHC